MSMSIKAISQREKGELPLSIGTSLAIESACGVGEEFFNEKPEIHEVDELWVNLRTLFRNLYGSVERNARAMILTDALVHGMLDDIRSLEATVSRVTHGRVDVIFYVCSFKDFERVFPNGHYKELKTERQKVEQELENQTLTVLVEDHQELNVRNYETRITDEGRRALMLTHYPVDLLWRSQFEDLRLLESHTGKIKPPAEWHTKLTGGKDLTRIPFNRLSIQVFGDGNVLFASMTPKIKQQIVELSDQYKWTAVTTEEKVRYGLNRLYDPRVKSFYTGLL